MPEFMLNTSHASTCLVKAKANRVLRTIFGSSSVAEPCLDKTIFPSPPSPRNQLLAVEVTSSRILGRVSFMKSMCLSQASGGGSSYYTDKSCWLQAGHRQGDQGCTRLLAGLMVLGWLLLSEHYVAAS